MNSCTQMINLFFAAKYNILKTAPKEPFVVFTTKHKILNTVLKRPFVILQ